MTRVVRNRVEGVAEPLPAGEIVLWSGRPQAWALARRLVRLDWVAGWFAVLTAWRGVEALSGGEGVLASLSRASTVLPGAAVGLALLALLGWLIARNSTYALTAKRLVIQTGVALPVTVNIPLGQIDGVALHPLRQGRADLLVTLSPGARLQPFAVWPHLKAWRAQDTQPMLRQLEQRDLDVLLPLLTAVLEGTERDAATQAATGLRAAARGAQAQVPAFAGPAQASRSTGLSDRGVPA